MSDQVNKSNIEIAAEDRTFPAEPFEKIAIALSGGGFRAATYSLGVLSMLHALKLDEGGMKTPLLEKVTFGSSTSGGTITLALYSACVHRGISFEDFFHHLDNQLQGEKMVHEAVRILKDDQQWKDNAKSRNIINAFSKVYHEQLFSIIGPPEKRILETLMDKPAHIEEVCFNATDFYTGISFRFQVGEQWQPNKGGRFGNNNIRINWENPDAVSVLQKIRLSDALACSSCFPMGFEPMVYPNDFTYSGGPDKETLKKAVYLKTYSTEKNQQPDPRSEKAVKEKAFSDAGEFALMDGGICDNQGLDSMLEANERDTGNDPEWINRFDLLMVCDVASFYMEPYTTPVMRTSKRWMQKTLSQYWKQLRGIFNRTRRIMLLTLIAAIVLAVLFVIPLILEGPGIAEVTLALVGILLLMTTVIVKSKANKYLRSNGSVAQILGHATIANLVHDQLPPEKSFQNMVIGKMTDYLQDVKTGVILQMLEARIRSSNTMIGEIFLKHVRRLIFEQLYTLPKLKYRRLNNVIYQLSFTNDINRRNPSFESAREEHETEDNERRAAFLLEWQQSVKLTDEMQRITELAYNTGTTLWFEKQQEADPLNNNRRALLASGQFTTCYNLIGYTLSLKHSRNFNRLDQQYKTRILSIAEQLKHHMENFSKDPFWLVKKYE